MFLTFDIPMPSVQNPVRTELLNGGGTLQLRASPHQTKAFDSGWKQKCFNQMPENNGEENRIRNIDGEANVEVWV